MVERYKPQQKIVGYMNPPEHTRFKKGVSGNPNGRPKKKLKLADIIEQELNAKVFITENGERIKIEKSHVLVKRVVNEAITKNSKDLIHLLKHQPLIDRFLADKSLANVEKIDYSKLTLDGRPGRPDWRVASAMRAPFCLRAYLSSAFAAGAYGHLVPLLLSAKQVQPSDLLRGPKLSIARFAYIIQFWDNPFSGSDWLPPIHLASAVNAEIPQIRGIYPPH